LVKRLSILSVLLVAVFICLWQHNHSIKSTGSNSVSFDLDSIKARGKLIAITDLNSTNYFIYNGEPMGFNYELLKSFSDHIGIDLEIVTENRLERAFDMLKTGEADLLAIGLTSDSSGKEDILFTDAVDETREVLIQRKPNNWRSLTSDDLDKKMIRNQQGLSGKTLYVEGRSSHIGRLSAMIEEKADSVNIIEVPYDSEHLIQNVASGEIDFTVCDENVALVNATYYPNIDVSTSLSTLQKISWGVRKNKSDALLHELNQWISAFRQTGSYALLHAKYFRNSRSSSIVKSDYYTLNSGKVSRYDDLIRQFSDRIKWDWRLLASLIYQESRFNPKVRSIAGAYGLMQIMPVTGKNFGIDITASPENNLRAGILYITWLNKIFDSKISDVNERLNFILASYNAGPGHILDAMNLAEKHGMDPHKWDGNVALWLKKKSDPRYYNDSVVRNGYFRGTESVNFVSEVLDRFEHYKNIIP
jgi:membrane-bound lytic murein transglycosylase F